MSLLLLLNIQGSTGSISVPSLSTIQILCLDENYEAKAGVAVDFRIVTIPSGDQNRAYSSTKKTATSGADGIASYNAPYGAVVEYKRGNATEWGQVTVAEASTTSVTSIIGAADV